MTDAVYLKYFLYSSSDICVGRTPVMEPLYPGQLQPQSATLRHILKYGENPHQEGAFYVEADLDRPCISNSEQLQGKELSLNNIYDTDAALETVKDYQEGACVVVKHNIPCGVATDESVVEAFLKAKACDPVSSFGGIVAFNREVDEAAAKELAAMFLEVVIAPARSPQGALRVSRTYSF